MNRTTVSLYDLHESRYPERPPFDPPEAYADLPYRPAGIDPTNRVYPAVRESLRLLGLDAARWGTPAWNPLGDLIRPGDHVVVKPNLVRHFHGDGLPTESLVTHGSIVRAVLDYAVKALDGKGKLTLGDSPLQYADFREVVRLAGAAAVVEEVAARSGMPIATVDFRRERSEKRSGMIVHRIPNSGDPMGYLAVEVGAQSRFRGLDERCPRFRVTQYDPTTMSASHNPGRHAYLFPATVLDADVVLNLPKLKTHRKAGLTAAMKNLVGINGSKDWLPHHAFGSVEEGGDEYLAPSWRKRVVSAVRDRVESSPGRLSKRALFLLAGVVKRTGRYFPFPDPFFEGSWYGNDTIWRTVHDLHRVLFFAGKDGVLRPEPQRRYLTLVDAIVAGEREGPMHPYPKPAGLLVGSRSPLAADLVCCRVMGFDERRLPILNYALGGGFHPPLAGPEEVEIRTNEAKWESLFALPRRETFAFEPSAGWKNHVELGLDP